MAGAVKKITADWSETGKTVYCIIRKEANAYRLADADGEFAEAPADPYISLTEDAVIKGRYELSESRVVWADGLYTVAIYKQAGGSPAPESDTIIGSGEMQILSDAEVIQTGDSYAIVNGDHGLVSIQDDLDSVKTTVEKVEDIIGNKLEITDATGAVTLYADNSSTPLLTGTVTDNSTTTTRTKLA
jgi:hypothetical protein